MTLKQRIVLSLAAMALMPLAHAIAADYDPPVAVEAEEYVPVEVGSGWYLRGDIGYALSASSDPETFRTYDPITGIYGAGAYGSTDTDAEMTFGAGVGYRFTDWIRADATVDGFRSDFNASSSSPDPCVDPVAVPAFAGTSCRTDGSSKFSAVSVMANGYVDLGTYVGITPYVGAGAGYSYVRWDGFNQADYCVGATCPTPVTGAISFPGDKEWRFTYAFMAGAAYDLTKNLKLDLGYKFRSIDGGDNQGWDGASAAAGATGTRGSDEGLTQHEVKVGLRYELW